MLNLDKSTPLVAVVAALLGTDCRTESNTSQASQSISSAPGLPVRTCYVAESFGATANDDTDDRASLQAAIEAAESTAGCVELEAGTYLVSRREGLGAKNIASLQISSTISLAGQGASRTVLAMHGSGATTAWQLLSISGDNVTVSDVKLSGVAAVNEQTHLVQINGPATKISIVDVDMAMARSGGGDCIRLLGSVNAWVDGVTIDRVRGLACDRSFVGFQRAIKHVTISNSESVVVGGQSIDLEPTGGKAFACSPIISDILITDSILRRGADARGLTVSIGGDGCALASRLMIRSSVVEDGGINIVDASEITLLGLDISDRRGPALHVRKRADRILVVGGSITKSAATEGPAVHVHSQNGLSPNDLTLIGVTVNQEGQAPAILVEDTVALNLISSKVKYAGLVAVKARGVERKVGLPVIVDTSFYGPLGTTRASVVGVGAAGMPLEVRVTGPGP